MTSDPILQSQQLFKRRFQFAPKAVESAPGALTLLGDFADRNQGLSLAACVNRHAHFAFSPRFDGKIALVSNIDQTDEQFWISSIQSTPGIDWINAVKGTLLELRNKGIYFGGFNGAVYSTFPVIQDLSGLSAIKLAAIKAVREMHPFKLGESGPMRPPERDKRGRLPALSKLEKSAIAKLSARVEERHGRGRLDWTHSLAIQYGKPLHLQLIDAHQETIEMLPVYHGVALVICPTGNPTPLSGFLMSRFQSAFEKAANLLRCRTLRAVDFDWLKARQHLLSDFEYRLAYHVSGENARVSGAVKAIEDDDILQLGRYLNDSFESAQYYLRTCSPESCLLARLAQEHPACLGAKILHEGDSELLAALIVHNEAIPFVERLKEEYARRTGRLVRPEILLLTPAYRTD